MNAHVSIEQDPQGTQRGARPPSWNQAAFCVDENCHCLIAGHALKPLDEVVNFGALFGILEQRAHRNTRAREDPGDTDAVGEALDYVTLPPVQHEASVGLLIPTGKGNARRPLPASLIIAPLGRP
jgi:hypothetical protein